MGFGIQGAFVSDTFKYPQDAMLIARDKVIMGDYRNGKLASTLGWLAFALMTGAALVMLSQYVGV